MRLVLDCETSGLPRRKLPMTDPSQPSIVQIACGLYDAQWREQSSFVSMVHLNGVAIEPEASAVHGKTEEMCARFGVPPAVAMLVLQQMSASALQIVVFNAAHEFGLIETQLHRLGADNLWWRKKSARSVCTMQLSTDIVAIKGEFGGFKFPSQEEAMHALFPDETYRPTHDAGDDMRTCARIAQALDDRGLIPPPFKPAPPFERMAR